MRDFSFDCRYCRVRAINAHCIFHSYRTFSIDGIFALDSLNTTEKANYMKLIMSTIACPYTTKTQQKLRKNSIWSVNSECGDCPLMHLLKHLHSRLRILELASKFLPYTHYTHHISILNDIFTTICGHNGGCGSSHDFNVDQFDIGRQHVS